LATPTESRFAPELNERDQPSSCSFQTKKNSKKHADLRAVGTTRTSGFLTRFTCLLNVVEQITALSMRHQILTCQRCFGTNQTGKLGFRPLRVVEQRRRKSVPKAPMAVKQTAE